MNPSKFVKIDYAQLDVFVVDENCNPARPWLTCSFDESVGEVLGFCLEIDPPNSLSAIKCLKHSTLPEDCAIVIDNGKEFQSAQLENYCLQQGMVIKHNRPGTPCYKGHVERYFKMLNEQLQQKSEPKSTGTMSLTTLCEEIKFMKDIDKQK